MSLLIPSIANKQDYNNYLIGKKVKTNKYKELKKKGKKYSTQFKEFPTIQEEKFKSILKDLRINFLFQHPSYVNNKLYILDFFIPNSTLVVEIDGKSHDSLSAYNSDIKRQNILENNGYKVIRFTDNEVMENDSSYFKDKLKIRY